MKKSFFISASLLFTAACFAQNAASTTAAKSAVIADSRTTSAAANASSATTVSADVSPAVDKANERISSARQQTRKARKRAAQEVAEKKKVVEQQRDNTKVEAGVKAETAAGILPGSSAGTETALRVNSQAIVPTPVVKTSRICVKPIRAGVTGNAGLNIK